MAQRERFSCSGFSLLEALIATVLLASAVVGLAHLVTLGAAQTRSSRHASTALVMAQSRLEQLRALGWTYSADGTRISSPALAPSPARSLFEDRAGWVDYLDMFGVPVTEASGTANYRRRWAVSRVSAAEEDTLQLQVCVFAFRRGRDPDAIADACVSTIRTRKP